MWRAEETAPDGLCRALGHGWSVDLTGGAAHVQRSSGSWLVDLADLAALYPGGVPEGAFAAVAACLSRRLSTAPDFAAISSQLVPCLWAEDTLPAGALHRRWRDGLRVGFGIAEPECTLAVTPGDLRAWGVTPVDVERAALANLRPLASRPQRLVAGLLYAISGGPAPQRSAANVLLPGLRLPGMRPEDGLWVGVPHRGVAVLLRAPRDEEPEWLSAARWRRAQQVVAFEHLRAAYPLSDRLYRLEAAPGPLAPHASRRGRIALPAV